MWKWIAIGVIGVCATLAAYNVADIVAEADKYEACIERFTPEECK